MPLRGAQSSPRVVMYTLTGCPYCTKALALLEQLGVAVKQCEVPRTGETAVTAELQALWEQAQTLRRSASAAGLQRATPMETHMTFPQIFRVVGVRPDGTELLSHIGGYDSLRAYDEAGGFSSTTGRSMSLDGRRTT